MKTQFDQNVLDTIHTLQQDKIEEILIKYIEDANTLMLASIFIKFGRVQPLHSLKNDLDHQEKKKQLGSYCSLLYSKHISKD